MINSLLRQQTNGIDCGFADTFKKSIAVNFIKILPVNGCRWQSQSTQHYCVEWDFPGGNTKPTAVAAGFIAHHVDVHIDDFHVK
jgi:hypothetical protein